MEAVKRVLSFILAATMVFALCGCSSADYKKAQKLFDSGQYDEAQVIFEDLGDYKDSGSYLEAIQTEKNKLGVEIIKAYLSRFGEVSIEQEDITSEDISFSGTLGEDNYEFHGKVALQKNLLEYTIRFPTYGNDLNTMDVRHMYWVYNNYQNVKFSEVSLAADLEIFAGVMAKMENDKADSEFITDAWQALFDARASEQTFLHWKYKMTVDSNGDYYEISARYGLGAQ